MARITFASSIQRHVAVPPADVEGSTVREVVEAVFAGDRKLRGYVLDDQGALRKHVVVFVDGRQIADRDGLGDAVPDGAEVHVFQALSGG